MKAMNVNTLLGAVTWEMIEPVEGKFDFSELDKVVLGARREGLHLVLLWFGSFKNALSTYAPGWLKKDVIRFPRVHIKDENGRLKTIELVSPFNQNAWAADSKARDRSSGATKAFNSPVPDDLLSYLRSQEKLHPMFTKPWPSFQDASSQRQNTSWESVFGTGIAAEEIFMVNAFSSCISRVAAAGRAEPGIPLYTKTWLKFDDPCVLEIAGIQLGNGKPAVAGSGAKAGVYSSGGPVPHALDIWNFHTVQSGTLDYISPDLYLHNYDWVCCQYRYKNNPLFIPEQKADLAGARRIWLAYGSHGAIGCSIHGIDTVNMDAKGQEAWTRSYVLLNSMSCYIPEVQAERPDSMFGFFFVSMTLASQRIRTNSVRRSTTVRWKLLSRGPSCLATLHLVTVSSFIRVNIGFC
ncbi:uncharacterized protein A1O9_06389 [Exophiala aquamarina CBS 119918]|uniref:Glycoside hydrolase family 42 N-terminal domain-containing protein n=1 Tax=Exophiala aquamarina CBS 119918 TaxID=1182545 RepID=A0A072PGN1_9EURO|nr:uncharacterized protein A1O9_06389 [Exophiala aquamarina CBS 119918]KEF58463.1 hypothetical protein A1O9_06389 [Exophiala aquamarina CBS 119918]